MVLEEPPTPTNGMAQVDDWQADAHVPKKYGGDDSVMDLVAIERS